MREAGNFPGSGNRDRMRCVGEILSRCAGGGRLCGRRGDGVRDREKEFVVVDGHAIAKRLEPG